MVQNSFSAWRPLTILIETSGGVVPCFWKSGGANMVVAAACFTFLLSYVLPSMKSCSVILASLSPAFITSFDYSGKLFMKPWFSYYTFIFPYLEVVMSWSGMFTVDSSWGIFLDSSLYAHTMHWASYTLLPSPPALFLLPHYLLNGKWLTLYLSLIVMFTHSYPPFQCSIMWKVYLVQI